MALLQHNGSEIKQWPEVWSVDLYHSLEGVDFMIVTSGT